MELAQLLIFAGALLGGYISGLTGFGTALTALPIWLFVVEPLVAGQVVVVCAVVSNIQTLPSIWKIIPWKRVFPFCVSALFGVPFGTLALAHLDTVSFRLGIGIGLVVYSSLMLLRRRLIGQAFINGNLLSDCVVGFCGGFLGGVAGLSGVLPTLWISLRNWGKDEKRGFFQGFNLVVLLFSMVAMQVSGYFTSDVFRLAAIAIPGTILGAVLGRHTYSRLSAARFDLLVLLVFLFSGIAMIIIWGVSRP
jgi:uncharacterized protein